MRHLLTAPVFDSEDQTQRARILHRVTSVTMAVTTIVMGAIMLVQPSIWVRAVVVLVVVDGLGLAVLTVSRRGQVRVASWLLVGGLVTLVAALAPGAGGVRSPGVGLFLVFVLMAGLLLGIRAGAAVAAVCMGVLVALLIMERTGSLPTNQVQYVPEAVVLLSCLYMGVVLVLLHLATTAMGGALARAERELVQRRQADRQLVERIKELTLMQTTAGLLQHNRPLSSELLADIVAHIPHAWLHPDDCQARIVIEGCDVRTPGWTDSPWLMSASLATPAGHGRIDVAYTREHPTADNGPFLHEESRLLTTLANQLAAFVNHQHTERKRRTLEQQLQQSQKMEALGTLAGGIAHDFNNILTAIGGNVELALDDVPAAHPARASLDEIAQAHVRATDLVRRILAFSRKRDSVKAPIDPAGIVDEVTALLRVSASKSISIVTSAADRLPQVYADATQMHQVVMNLGTNAIHAMSTRGGTLTIDLRSVTLVDPQHLPSDTLRPGNFVRLSVSDTGSGMPPEVLERLFEPFFTTKGESGTGLGLPVVHGIVTDHGGAILVSSVVGQGTTFEVYLPAVNTA